MYALDDLGKIQKLSSECYLTNYPNSRMVFISPKVFTLEMYPVANHVQWLLGRVLNPLKIKFMKPNEFNWQERKKTRLENELFTVLTLKLLQRSLIMHHHMVFTEIPLAECQGLSVNVFHSMDFFAYMGPLLLVLQSTNPSAVGVWDTTLLSPLNITPEDIENVSQENLIEEAHKRGYRVAFVNLNYLTLDDSVSIQCLIDNPTLLNSVIFNASLALRRLSNESESEECGFKSQGKTSDEVTSLSGENEVGSNEERLQAWIDRAQKYWLSLTSKVNAIAFVAPSDPIIQSIYLETGDAFMVPAVLVHIFELPKPEKVRSWFMDNAVQFIRSRKPVGESVELRMNASKAIPSFSGGDTEERLMHKNVIRNVLDYFDNKMK
nr:hypothetical transcript [Hymenolepis microstoma]